MREGPRNAIIVVTLLAAVAAMLCAPLPNPIVPNPPVFATAVAVVGVGVVLLTWARFRRERLPDHLRAACRPVHEAGGLTIGAVLEREAGRTWLVVYFQNRFERPCVADVGLTRRAFRLRRRTPLENAAMRFHCPGGAFGVARVPFPSPENEQGRRRSFTLSASTRYIGGRGRLLRYRPGRSMAVGGEASSAGAILTILLGIGPALLLSMLAERGPATRRIRLRHPTPADENPADRAARPAPIEILWSLDELRADTAAPVAGDEVDVTPRPLETRFEPPPAALEAPRTVLTNA